MLNRNLLVLESLSWLIFNNSNYIYLVTLFFVAYKFIIPFYSCYTDSFIIILWSPLSMLALNWRRFYLILTYLFFLFFFWLPFSHNILWFHLESTGILRWFIFHSENWEGMIVPELCFVWGWYRLCTLTSSFIHLHPGA